MPPARLPGAAGRASSRRPLGLAGGGEDGAGVILEDGEPRGHVGGVVGARMVGDTKVGQDHAA